MSTRAISIRNRVWVFLKTIKYWLQGQDWKEANEYAKSLVVGWKTYNYKEE